jgi:hypothetical protein
VSNFEEAMSCGSFCMDNSLWYSLSVKMSEFIDKMEICHGDRAVLAGSNGILIIVNNSSV